MSGKSVGINTVFKYFWQKPPVKVSYRRFKRNLKYLIGSGDPEALVVGSVHQIGRNVTEEVFFENKEKYLLSAINQNFSPAMVHMAEIFYQRKMYDKAFELYERAAKLNNAYALKILAIAYRIGEYNYPVDEEKYRSLLKLSEQGLNWNSIRGWDASESDFG